MTTKINSSNGGKIKTFTCVVTILIAVGSLSFTIGRAVGDPAVEKRVGKLEINIKEVMTKQDERWTQIQATLARIENKVDTQK